MKEQKTKYKVLEKLPEIIDFIENADELAGAIITVADGNGRAMFSMMGEECAIIAMTGEICKNCVRHLDI